MKKLGLSRHHSEAARSYVGPETCQSALEGFSKRIPSFVIPGRVVPQSRIRFSIAGRADFELIDKTTFKWLTMLTTMTMIITRILKDVLCQQECSRAILQCLRQKALAHKSCRLRSS